MAGKPAERDRQRRDATQSLRDAGGVLLVLLLAVSLRWTGAPGEPDAAKGPPTPGSAGPLAAAAGPSVAPPGRASADSRGRERAAARSVRPAVTPAFRVAGPADDPAAHRPAPPARGVDRVASPASGAAALPVRACPHGPRHVHVPSAVGAPAPSEPGGDGPVCGRPRQRTATFSIVLAPGERSSGDPPLAIRLDRESLARATGALQDGLHALRRMRTGAAARLSASSDAGVLDLF